jgi:hypothetical protein
MGREKRGKGEEEKRRKGEKGKRVPLRAPLHFSLPLHFAMRVGGNPKSKI